MKKLTMVVGLMACGALAFAAAKKEEIVKPADQAKFEAVPNMTGITKAALWGDEKKEHGGLTKFAAGFTTPMHTHSKDVKLVVISGTIVHGDKDGKITKLGPGSYLFVPANLQHTTACDQGSECLFYEEQPGEFDLKPFEMKKAEAPKAAEAAPAATTAAAPASAPAAATTK